MCSPCSPLMKCATCTIVILAAFILTLMVVVRITGGPGNRDPPPPSTRPPLPRVGKVGSFDNHPRDPVTHETLFGLINFFQNRQEGDQDSASNGHHQLLSLMVVIFLIALLAGLVILIACCLRGRCSKILTLAPVPPSSNGAPHSSHLPLAVLPPTISAPHHLTLPESHPGQAQMQRPYGNPAFPQDNWRLRFEHGGGETVSQHPSLVDDRLVRSPVAQGSSVPEAQPGLLAPNSWYAPRAPALELDMDHRQPAFSPPTTHHHPPGCLQATIGVIESAVRAGHNNPDTYPLALSNAGRSFPLPTPADSQPGEDSRETTRVFEGKEDSSQLRIQQFLDKACSLIRDHQGNRLTPLLMRSFPLGLPIHATIVIHYFLRRIRACCMDSQPVASLWIVPDFCELWTYLPPNVGLHVVDFPTWRQPSPTRLIVDMESRKMELRPCLQLLRELSHPLLQQLHALAVARAGCTRPFYRAPVGRLRSALPPDTMLPITRQLLDACRLAALKVAMKPQLVRKFDYMMQVSTLLASREMKNLPSCVWSALIFQGMAYSYPLCYPMRLPTIHPVPALTHLKIGGDEDVGAPSLPISESPNPRSANDTYEQGDPVEKCTGGEDSGMESGSPAPPPTSPSSPASSGSPPGQEEIDWNQQWSQGIVNPPQTADVASG